MIRDVRFDITTDGSGDYTATSSELVIGRLVAIEHTLSGLDATADTTLEVVNTPGGVDRTLSTLTNVNTDEFHEVMEEAKSTAHGSSSQYDYPVIVGNLKLTVEQGGAANTGIFVAYVENGDQ